MANQRGRTRWKETQERLVGLYCIGKNVASMSLICLLFVHSRRKHKKGTTEETVKKRTRRNVKFDRAIQGATLEQILQKRNQSQDVRKAQREQLIRSELQCHITYHICITWNSISMSGLVSGFWTQWLIKQRCNLRIEFDEALFSLQFHPENTLINVEVPPYRVCVWFC